MNALVAGAIAFVVIGMVLMIGQGMNSLTYATVSSISGANSTALGTVNTNVGTANTTFSSFLSILAIALVGGLSVAYVVSYIGRGAQVV